MFNTMFNHTDQWDRWSWHDNFEDDWLGSREGRIAIVGRPDTGKRTLCSTLWDWDVAGADAAQDDLIHRFGLFYLVELAVPSHEADNLLFQLERVELLIYLIDASVGDVQEDFEWIARLKALDATLLIVLNKADLCQADELKSQRAALEQRLARPIVTLSGQDQKAVRRQFLPVVVKACPRLEPILATEVISLRRRVAHKLIRETVLASRTTAASSMMVGASGNLTEIQTTMVDRIALLYGYQPHRHSFLQTLIQFVGKFGTSSNGHLETQRPSSIILAFESMTTWVIGHLAVAYYSGNLPTFNQWFTGKNPYDTLDQADE